MARLPAQFALDAAWVDRVATVVTGAVGDQLDKLGVMGSLWLCLIQCAADQLNDLPVRALPSAADAVTAT